MKAKATLSLGAAWLLFAALAAPAAALTLPTATTGAASDLTQTTATLNGEVNPNGVGVTDCRFEYGTTTAYGHSEACVETAGSGSSVVAVHADLTGLEPGTFYHFRLDATNANGTAHGADRTFPTVGPGFGLTSFEDLVKDMPGNPFTRAGGRPYAQTTAFVFNKTVDAGGNTLSDEQVKDVYLDLPAGFLGNPLATPRCTNVQYRENGCPIASQVGTIEIVFPESTVNEPVFNMVPLLGTPARFEFNVQGLGTMFTANVRSGGDYGVTATTRDINQIASVIATSVTLWGVPADPSHDAERGRICFSGSCVGGNKTSDAPLKPFLTNPTSCAGPLTATVHIDSWQNPGNFVSKETTTPALSGCDKLDFSPTLAEARPTTNLADSPSGLSVDLHVPQSEACAEVENAAGEIEAACENAEANLRDAKVTLPAGLSVNPAEANGLGACTEAQVGYKPGTAPLQFSPEPAQCPDAAKLGTVSVLTPLLDHPIGNGEPGGPPGDLGAVYLAKPFDNPFGSLLALYIAIDDPQSGTVLKLAGKVSADPATGQLTASFDENPQLPFEDFKLRFFGGAQGALRTPATCGAYTTTSVLTPWSGTPPATPSDTYAITRSPGGGACPTSAAGEPNSPGFDAGTLSPIAAAYSPLIIHLRREDGSQQFSKLTLTPPPGLLGKLAGIPYCPEAALALAKSREHPGGGAEELASPACPAASHVGVVNVAAGPGPAPYWVQGQAYLAGPYKGAPLSLAILTPAVAGPFDLGVVLTRVALQVNPETAQITAVSDPIPSILEGIPLDVRTIAVKLDRPQFTLNPTSCDPMAFAGTSVSTLEGVANLQSRFQLGECAPLGFKPKLSLQLKGSTKRSGHPALRAVLRMKPGEANIARAQVTLPHSEFLDQGHIGTVCTRVQFAAGNVPGEKCPAASIYGFARAVTPLLEKPVEGPVYLRSSSHKLPDLVAALNGQIDVALDGKIDTGRGGGIRNSFEVVPDAPVSKFTLEMKGGSKGLLVNSEGLCGEKPHRAIADFTAQNGKVSDTEPALKSSCRKKAGGKRHHRAKRARGRAAG